MLTLLIEVGISSGTAFEPNNVLSDVNLGHQIVIIRSTKLLLLEGTSDTFTRCSQFWRVELCEDSRRSGLVW
jgi:hypothetical protein